MKPLPTLSLLCASLFSCAAFSADVTPDVIMKFESLNKPVLAANGSAFAVEVSPDRGDSHGMVKRLGSEQSFTVAGGSKPLISHDEIGRAHV